MSYIWSSEVYQEVITAVRNWRAIATELGINRAEQERMKTAFRVE
ncbi:hypothetical protein [Lonepinella sp. BR2357]